MLAGFLACIRTPGQGNRHLDGVTWCADNGCFGKGYPGDEEWFGWLEANAYAAKDCMFATAPDVVGNAYETLERSAPWLAKIRSLGYPAALVAQDGLEDLLVPWDEFDVLFIGGSTEWKLGPGAASLIREAKARGKGVHAGRVNSRKRFKLFEELECDSADGTFIAFGPDKNLPIVMSWLGHDWRGSVSVLETVDCNTNTRVVVDSPLSHRCPYVKEADNGTVEVTYVTSGKTFELHSLRRYLDSFAGDKISHEELTQRIKVDLLNFPDIKVGSVVTKWTTAGMTVRCEA